MKAKEKSDGYDWYREEKEEDGCEKCGREYSIHRPFCVHHKDGNRDHNDRRNLLFVCRSCHGKIHYGSEGYHSLYLQLPDESRTRKLSEHPELKSMSDLEDTFGEDFVEDYEQTIAKKREEREKLTEEAAMEIAHKAINEEQFKDGEPTFQHTTENDVTHDVFLMMLPSMDEGKSIFDYVNSLDSGAVTCPLDYLDEWWSCLFNDPELLKSMEPGQHYIVVGRHGTYENKNGQMKDQVSPVRGALSLDEAKEMANEFLDSEVNDQEPEEEEDEEDEDDDSSSTSFGGFGTDDSDEDEDEDAVDYDDVEEQVEALADDEPAVWEVEEGDDRLETLVKVICQNLDVDFKDDDVSSEVAEKALEVIDSHGEDDDDEEDNLF